MKSAVYCLLSLLIVITGCNKKLPEPTSLSVSPTGEIFFDSSGTMDAKIQVTTNLEFLAWEVSVDVDWCWVKASRVSGYFQIYVWGNYDFLERTTFVRVTSKETAPVYIRVRQAGSSFAILPSTTQQISAAGGTIDVAIKSDASWTVQSGTNWAVVDTQSGKGDDTIRVTVAPNPNRKSDLATISFRSKGSSRNLEIRRTSNPDGAYIDINPSKDQKLPVGGGVLNISINAKGPWSVSSSSFWATVETSSGVGNGATRILVDKNTNNSNAVATIYFSAGTANAELQVEREYTDTDQSGTRHIRQGYSGDVVYTIKGKHILKGYSGSVVYTIDGKHILNGYSGSVAYTIDGKHILKGYSGSVVYTIDGKHILQGYSGNVVFTID